MSSATKNQLITNIPCIILAGGKSSRMGEDKSLLPFGDYDTMIEYQYKKLSSIFKDVYISSKNNKFNFDANLILDDTQNESSPMIALQTIFKKIDSDQVFIITVDVPLIEIETIKSLIYNSKGYDITIASDDERIHNLCGIFSKNILKNINEALNNGIHKINYLIRNTPKNQSISFSNKDQFLNLNEKNTYFEALSISKSYRKY